MQALKRMDHRQIEGKLQEAYDAGFRAGKESAGAGTAETGENERRKWKQAVETALELTKGIGPGRKELFRERLNRELERQQDPEKLQ